jgi:hypothetical protein
LYQLQMARRRRDDAARHRVAVGIGALGGFDQLGDDVFRGRLVGVAHAEVDDVLAAGASLGLQIVDDVEDVRRQAFDALEVGVQECVPKELNHGGSGGRSALGPKANGKSDDCRAD